MHYHQESLGHCHQEFPGGKIRLSLSKQIKIDNHHQMLVKLNQLDLFDHKYTHIIFSMQNVILYSGKVWWGESLAKLLFLSAWQEKVDKLIDQPKG